MNREIWVVQEVFGEVVSQYPKAEVVLIAEGPKRFVAQARAGDVVWRICMHKKKQVEKAWNSLERSCESLAAVGITKVVIEGGFALSKKVEKVTEN